MRLISFLFLLTLISRDFPFFAFFFVYGLTRACTFFVFVFFTAAVGLLSLHVLGFYRFICLSVLCCLWGVGVCVCVVVMHHSDELPHNIPPVGRSVDQMVHMNSCNNGIKHQLFLTYTYNTVKHEQTWFNHKPNLMKHKCSNRKVVNV